MMQKQKQKQQTLLCIDVSYLLFYRVNAIRTWYKHRHKQDASDEALDATECKTKLLERIQATLHQLCKTHRADVVLCAYDGHKNWRKREYQAYKKGRKHDSIVLKLFQYGQDYIANHPLSLSCPVHHMHHEALEADDFIHFATRHCSREIPNARVVIIANDHDYLPLLGNPNVCVLNLKAKHNELHLPMNTVINRQMTGDEYLQYKILVGDKSDNISAVFKRCGKKTAMKLVADKQKLAEQFEKGGESAMVNYQLNTKLIDNRLVPQKLQEWMEEHLGSLFSMLLHEHQIQIPLI